MILIDTSVWVAADKDRESPEGHELAKLAGRDEAATTGVVMAEVLQGARTAADWRDLLQELTALHYFHSDQAAWIRAGQLSFQLRRRGQTTPLSDLIIAAVALENDLTVYARDSHFRRVPGLKIHEVGS